MNKEKGLYIHVPFCKSKCKYCDFASYSGREKLVPEYFSYLETELLSYKEIFHEKGYKIGSIFIGGGTPSIVDEKYIASLLTIIKKNFHIVDGAEITIEANPETVSQKVLEKYFSSGINRISFGLQTADDRQLRILGRIHDFSDYIRSIRLAREAGFSNISTDLITGIPDQDWPSLRNTLDLVLKEEPVHLSCYSLIIEENTPFYEMKNKGLLNQPAEVTEREMYHNMISYLEERGYVHYEISNFSKPGYESKHNINYWKANEYIGIGLSSHSYFEGIRYSNVAGLNEYIRAVKTGTGLHEDSDIITQEESMKEFMMLGLRMIEGVSSREFDNRYNKDMFEVFKNEIDNLKNLKLVDVTTDYIKLNKKGLDYANIAFMEFV